MADWTGTSNYIGLNSSCQTMLHVDTESLLSGLGVCHQTVMTHQLANNV